MKYALLVLCAILQARAVERWGFEEIRLNGPSSGNPFIAVQLRADFHRGHRTVSVDGFYDGGGIYKIRFMPDTEGEWTWITHSNLPELENKTGKFVCTPARAGNHGPVVVNNTYHFAHADGTFYYPIGTTAYAWTHQGDALEENTLETLRTAPFNKMRMCVFPKSYAWNRNEPVYYPFPRNAAGANDTSRFEPEFFRHLEKRVLDLQKLGIEADLILFHPYDRWGYAKMSAEVDNRYLRYIVARLAAFRNVWWSLANEYDFMKEKTMPDWDRFFRILTESDPYSHLRSIHNSGPMYDHAKPWVTHVSVQSYDFEKVKEWLAAYRKPVVFDECQYEGDIPRRWGNISAHEMVRRFWMATAQGAYAGHGETYLEPNDILWWSKGGVLRGQSAPRIAFLRKILEDSGTGGLNPTADRYYPSAMKPGVYYLYYFDSHQPGEYEFDLPPGAKYQADFIDPWAMTVTAAPGRYEGKFTIKLPAKPYMAVRFRSAIGPGR